MKSYCKYIGLMLLPLFAVACDDGASKNYIDMPRPADELKLTANIDTLVLSAAQGNDAVLSFKWNKVAPPVDTIEVKYLFRMGVAGTKFADGQSSEFVEAPDCEISYGADDLNDLLSTWGITPNNASELEVQAVAQYPNEDKYFMPMVSQMSVVVTTFAPQSRPAFMQNKAIDPGYNPHIPFSEGMDMKEIILGKMYSWTGWFSKSDGFYVSFSEDGKGQCIIGSGDGCTLSNNPPTASELIYPPKDGYFTMSLNSKTKEVKWDIIVPWKRMFLIGMGFPGGDWNNWSPDELVKDPVNPEISFFEGLVRDVPGTGEFKFFLETGNWDTDAFMPPSSSPGVVTHVTLEHGVPSPVVLIPRSQPDNKFLLPSPGVWRVEFNMNLMTATAFKK